MLVAGRRIANLGEGEAELFGERFEDRDRLLAERAVDMNEFDLLTLEVAAFLVGDVLHDGRGLRPIGRGHGEDGWEYRAVGGIGAAVERGDHVHAILKRAGNHGARNRRREEVHENRAIVLEALVGLDAALRLVARVHDLKLDRRSLDAAAPVQIGDIVALALAVFGGEEGIHLREVERRPDLDGLGVLRDGAPAPEHEQGRKSGKSRKSFHKILPIFFASG